MAIKINGNTVISDSQAFTSTSTVSATGNITGGNILTGGAISATGNIRSASVFVAGEVSATANVTGQFISSAGGNIGVPDGVLTMRIGHETPTTIIIGTVASNVSIGNTNSVTAVAGNLTTGGYISAAGNIIGNLITTTISASGNITGGNLNITGNIVDTGALSIITGSNGNLTLNAGSGFIVASSGIINGQANGVGNIGNSTGYFNTIFAKATSAQYADLAEKYTADADYAPGTVVMFGGTAEVTLCVNDGCSRVAGVVSTNPSYRMNDGLQSEHTAMVALTGRVPTRVTGTVRKGDLMVSAGNGLARAEADPRVGTVIGKALADSEGDAVIEVVVGRV